MNVKANLKQSLHLFFPSFCALIVCVLGIVIPGNASGQIYVTNMGSSPSGTGTVGEYDLLTGTPINTSLVSGLSSPTGIGIFGGTLFVASYFSGIMGAYDLATGAAVNTSFITGLSSPNAIAVSGGKLFVTSFFGGKISEYDAATGTALNTSFITGLYNPTGIFISGNSIFVTNGSNAAHIPIGSIGQYDLATGAVINSSLVSNLDGPWGLTISGGNIFVINNAIGSLGEYSLSGTPINGHLAPLTNPLGITESGGNLLVVNGGGTIAKYATSGTLLNASFIAGPINNFPEPVGIIALQPAPEPSTWGLLVVAAASFIGLRRKGWFLSSRC
jgi:hypothetical protein